jgi:NhaA family Na+:H+ antiporter
MDLIEKENQQDSVFNAFLHSQTASGIILLLVSGFAFYLANSSFWQTYNQISHTHLSLSIGDWQLDLDINHWVNEGLMVLFFFLVGLEIKREVMVGELSNPRKAALAVYAALGGMIVPALIYSLFNLLAPETRGGWGVPMATDIAFVVGVLSVLGSRVPLSLKVFVTSLAIVDDLGAILVIALFYTEDFQLMSLFLSLMFVGASYLYGKVLNGSRGVIYAALCIGCWYFMLESGIHSTIAGVIMAFTIPLRQKYDLTQINEELKESFDDEDFDLKEHHMDGLARVIRNVEGPLYRFEHLLHPWVGFLIMPLFAFFNAGVHLPSHLNWPLLFEPHVMGIYFGLLMGKPLGILLACRFAVAKGWAFLPTGVNWKAMIGVSYLAGLGFTMSLFISVLAFIPGSHTLEEAKLGILAASISAMLIGAPLTWFGLAPPKK